MNTPLQSTSGDGQLDARQDGTTSLVLNRMAVIARGLSEYRQAFNLDKTELRSLLSKPDSTILDLPGSTSSFALQMRGMAKRFGSNLKVYSADIIYSESADAITAVANETAQQALAPLLKKNSWGAAEWASSSFTAATPSEWLEYRLATYKAWHKDFSGEHRDYYRESAFPHLESLNGLKFDLIVSGNCLFAYEKVLVPDGNEDQVYDFHLTSLKSMAELLKPEGKLKVYPIGTGAVPIYPRLDSLISALENTGFEAALEEVRNPPNCAQWTQMLVVTRPRS